MTRLLPLMLWGLALVAQPRLTTNSSISWVNIRPTQGLRSSPYVHNQDRLSRALPYAVDVTNQGSQPIELLALVFNISGLPRKEFIFNSFNNPNDPVVPTGATRLFTPFRTYNALSAGAQNAYLIGKDGKPMSENVDKFRAFESIRVDVDLVVLADGSYYGPDTTHTISIYSARSRAFQDLKTELTIRATSGEDVQGWLQGIASRKLVHMLRDQSNTAYLDAQVEYAGIFLRHFNRTGSDLVQALAKDSRFQTQLSNLHKGDR